MFESCFESSSRSENQDGVVTDEVSESFMGHSESEKPPGTYMATAARTRNVGGSRGSCSKEVRVGTRLWGIDTRSSHVHHTRRTSPYALAHKLVDALAQVGPTLE